jgi:uncharacterized protein
MLPRTIGVFGLLLCTAGLGHTAGVVISQVYGGGGNNGATYRNDFIELFNGSSNAVTIAGWSVQYAAAGGTAWQLTLLSGTMQPGQYYLVQESSGGSNGTNLPSADRVGNISMSGTAGKVALVSNSVALLGDCPIPETAIIDFVGYGTTASCAEGGRAPTHTSSTSLQRVFAGCVDTDDNGADFFTASVTPRNSASAPHDCNAVPRAYTISEIQGTNSISPLAGQSAITTTNIVTAVRNNGFFLQTPDGADDGNALSSEGVFVFTGATPGTNAQRGQAVVVTGTVTEFRPAGDPTSPSLTQINATHLRFVSFSNLLPAPVSIQDAVPPAGGHEQLERFEGMRVMATLEATGPTGGFVDEANATATSSGAFYGTLGVRAPREPGIDIREALPDGAPCCVPRFDGNPEILRIDSDGQSGASRTETRSGTIFVNLVGPLYYQARRYSLLPDSLTLPAIPGLAPLPPEPTTNHLTIASLNLQRFYNAADEAGGDVVLTTAAYSNRLEKAGLLLRDIMHRPDILGLAEVENASVLEDLSRAISDEHGTWLVPGNDSSAINVGFLVNTARVQVVEVTQHGNNATFTHPVTGTQVTLHDRPPLLLRAHVADPASTNVLAVTVIMNHLRSLLDIESADNGAFIRAKRRAQAEFLSQLVQQRQARGEHVVVMGDFNAFEFNDGYVDVVGTVAGAPAPSNEVVLASADLVDPDLFNLIETLPAGDRYSYIFDGTPQALDHVLISQKLRGRVERFLYVRTNADFPESSRNDPEIPHRLSDHDAAMVYLTLNVLPRVLSVQHNGTEVVLEGEGASERDYAIERSEDLQLWIEIGSAAAHQAGRFSFRDLNPVSGAAFYRVRASDQN